MRRCPPMSKHYGRVSLYALLEPEEGGQLLCPLVFSIIHSATIYCTP
jgi:hypothetical protein